MHSQLPHFLLHARPNGEHHSSHKSLKRWSFRLVDSLGNLHFEATDFESEVTLERLSLLAVVRGLEWLDQPSRVTLVNPNQCVSRGLRYGLERWRDTDWRWERFGQMTLVRNADLWQRIDVALAFHQLNCQTIRTDAPHSSPRAPHFARLRRKRQRKVLETV